MATRKQKEAAKRNVKKAQSAAREKRTLANLPKSPPSELGRDAANARSRDGRPGHRLEDRTREQLYDVARKAGIRGRSKMGKGELIEAIRRSR